VSRDILDEFEEQRRAPQCPSVPARLGDSRGVAAGAELRDWIAGCAEVLAHLRAQRPHVRCVRVDDDPVRLLVENASAEVRDHERSGL